MIATNIDYMDFIEIGYVNGCILHVYTDHLYVNIQDWLNDEKIEVLSPEDKHS